ncbi:hypothetical protein V8C86DRAFT_2593250 [Haematococcus lacustris]
MAFFWEYLNHSWERALKHSDEHALKNWVEFLDSAERDRQRDRIIAWRDRVSGDNFAVNAGEYEYYRRTSGFLWRIPDATCTHKARDHQYLYNLEKYGHKVYTRRDKASLSTAQQEVERRVTSGELGPLSPLE